MASAKGTKGWLAMIATKVGKLVVEAEETQRSLPGKVKKAWVKRSLKDWLKKIDIPWIPDWLEGRIKAAVIDALIDFVCALLSDKKATSAFAK